jgi:autoinducer 2-degrading protein
MHVTLVHAHVAPAHIDEFVEATLANARESVREPGNLRFDILRSADDPARFVFYEAYRDEAAAAAHKETAHYLRWRAAVADWMAEPRVGVRYDGLFPAVDGTAEGEAPAVDGTAEARGTAGR